MSSSGGGYKKVSSGSSPSSSCSSAPTLTSASSSSSSNKKFKEKILGNYEILFGGGSLELSKDSKETFWREFFLVKPKVCAFENELLKCSGEDLVNNCRENLSLLLQHSIGNLGEENHSIKIIYALQTICALFKGLFKKQEGLDLDLINLVINPGGEAKILKLLDYINHFLLDDRYPTSLKDLCLKLLLIIVTGIDVISKNSLLEFLMNEKTFEALIHLLSHNENRVNHGHCSVLLLTLLVQYRKHENTNPYIVKLSILDQELSLLGYGQVITSSLTGFTSEFESVSAENNSAASNAKNGGWLTSFTSMVGNMFVSDDSDCHRVLEKSKSQNCVLLALYEAVHLNRNFIATLAHYQTNHEKPDDPATNGKTTAHQGDDLSPTINTSPSSTTPGAISSNDTNEESSSSTKAPSNLLVTFLEYCSIVMQDTKSESSYNTVKLNFLLLLCVTEDQYANALMHDPNLVFRVCLHRAPMRHRNSSNIDVTRNISKPLACSVLDVMIEFVRSHMMKKFPYDLYLHSLSVIHRLLSYQKQSRIRFRYPWKELWTALMALLKFITSNETSLIKKINVFAVGCQVITIFNLFITYGDTFLPSPSSYDELYYEMVRCTGTFDALYSMALRYSTAGGRGSYKESAVKLTNGLVNIRAITSHFNPKINAWLAAQQLSTPTEDQILDVVKSNYDSLTLKLQEGLDQYERYVESPTHSEFFDKLLQNVVQDTRNQIQLNDFELQVVLQDFSSIN